MGETFCNHILDKGLISKNIQNINKLIKLKKTELTKIWAEL